tara:strand:- start:39859 stop:40317 length:459 start_codon:yes stop_codon:yes gene_type:complete
MLAEPDSRELSVECTIDAPPQKVWDIMTGQQEEWWCPKPWRAKIDHQDRRAGGRCDMTFYGPDGEKMPQNGIYLAYEPGRRFVTTDAFTADFMPQEPFMIGIWELIPQGEGTLYRATARHWTEEARQQHKDMGFEEGWKACAAQLKALVEGQ